MKKISINPIPALIIVLLIAVFFFSPRISPQIAEKKTLEDKVISLEIEKQTLEERVAKLETKVVKLERSISEIANSLNPKPCRGKGCP